MAVPQTVETAKSAKAELSADFTILAVISKCELAKFLQWVDFGSLKIYWDEPLVEAISLLCVVKYVEICELSSLVTSNMSSSIMLKDLLEPVSRR